MSTSAIPLSGNGPATYQEYLANPTGITRTYVGPVETFVNPTPADVALLDSLSSNPANYSYTVVGSSPEEAPGNEPGLLANYGEPQARQPFSVSGKNSGLWILGAIVAAIVLLFVFKVL